MGRPSSFESPSMRRTAARVVLVLLPLLSSSAVAFLHPPPSSPLLPSSTSPLRSRDRLAPTMATPPTTSKGGSSQNPFGDFSLPGFMTSFSSINTQNNKAPSNTVQGPIGADVVRRYFTKWNERKMDEAIDLFTDDCSYEDTLYPEKFVGKDSLRFHLLRVADALPSSFAFVVDDISDGGESIGVQWHVESNGSPLPFTRGSSMYRLDETRTKIAYGFDVPEPTVKSGSVSLAVLSLVSKLLDSPRRLIPLAAWAFYNWLVFLSDVAPGPNALSLDPATWREVLDLSLNFWLIVPTLAQDNAPIVHPVLEGVFNLLLAWAALFSGFLIDGRRTPPTPPLSTNTTNCRSSIDDGDGDVSSGKDKNGFLPYLLGMQFLTNAIYLPYLVFRPTTTTPTTTAPLTKTEAFGESKAPTVILATVALYSVIWSVGARPEFGDLAERLSSFISLASGDRLTFSFLVDLVYFGVFQGWLMDDDLRRRMGVGGGEGGKLPPMGFCKRVPVVGLVYYLLTRPSLRLEGGGEGSGGGGGVSATTGVEGEVVVEGGEEGKSSKVLVAGVRR